MACGYIRDENIKLVNSIEKNTFDISFAYTYLTFWALDKLSHFISFAYFSSPLDIACKAKRTKLNGNDLHIW